MDYVPQSSQVRMFNNRYISIQGTTIRTYKEQNLSQVEKHFAFYNNKILDNMESDRLFKNKKEVCK